MRLIDADALKENTFGVYTQEHGNIEVVSCDAIIDDAPTIDAVPVVRGKWEFLGDWTSRCTACNTETDIDHNDEYRFCPNCGAKMESEA